MRRCKKRNGGFAIQGESMAKQVHGNNKLFGKRTGKKIAFGKKRKCSSISGLNIERNILKPIESKKD